MSEASQETRAEQPRERRTSPAAAGLALVLAGLAVYALAVEPYWPVLSEHQLGSGPVVVTVLHLTDLHVAEDGPNEAWVREQVRIHAPDLIVITGDVIRSPLDAVRAEAAAQLLSDLKAPLGVFGCVGNHDDWQGQPALDVYARGGVVLLRAGRSVSLLEGRLQLHGVSQPGERPPLGTPGAYDLLLSHYPSVLEGAAEQGMDLVLAGHTHGGQVRVPFWGSLWLPPGSGPYEQGWFERGSTRMHVTRGMGMSILPVRFLARPEAALVRLLVPR